MVHTAKKLHYKQSYRSDHVASVFLVLACAFVFIEIAKAHTGSRQEMDSGKLPEFDIASIKPVDSRTTHVQGVAVLPGGRVLITKLPLKALILVAFNVGYWQVSGGDAWTERDEFNIEAKPPEPGRSNNYSLRSSLFRIEDERLRQMLQALLIERFQLKCHWESRSGKVYWLERSGGKALRLHQTEALSPEHELSGEKQRGSIGWAGSWVVFNVSTAQLAQFASDNVFHCPVVDHTGMIGRFDYRSPTKIDEESHFNDQIGSFLNLIAEIGLKIRTTTGIIESLVIEHVEKPSPN